MICANQTFLNDLEALAQQKKAAILNAEDKTVIKGTADYVSNDGCDDNDGLTPETAWAASAKVSAADLKPGDGVLFRRGDIFRGAVTTKPGVTYAAFGEGPKPRLYGWNKNLADAALWSEVDAAHHIWKLNELILDCG